MTATQNLDKQERESAPRGQRPVNGGHNSLRRQIRIGAAVLLAVNLAVGLFARQQLHAIINYAVNI